MAAALSSSFKTAVARLERLLRWLSPAQLGFSEEERHAHHLLVSIGIITLVFSLLYVAVSYVIGYQVGVVLMSLDFLLLLVILAAFRQTGRFRLYANLYLASCLFVAVLGCSFFSGGIHSMVTPWFALVPVTSVLLLGLRVDTVVWALLACGVVALYGLAGMLGYDFPLLYETRFTDFFHLVCIVGLVMILSMIAFIFGYNRRRAMAMIVAQKVALEGALGEIEYLAFHDALTQLPNRRLFIDRLGQAMAESSRNCSHGAVMFLDLDNFKPLNDQYGHEAGDMLLVKMAERLTGCVREVDTVARFGGDEFAIVLGSLDADMAAAREQASAIAEKIGAVLAEPYALRLEAKKGAEITVIHRCTASIGVVLFLDHGCSHKELLDWADKAMYQAKAEGKNTVSFYTAPLASQVRERSIL